MGGVMRKLCCDCMVAKNLEEAHSVYQKYLPDLVVSDWNLSEGETAAHFVKMASDSSLVLVVSSSDVGKKAIECGASAFASKPVDFDKICIVDLERTVHPKKMTVAKKKK